MPTDQRDNFCPRPRFRDARDAAIEDLMSHNLALRLKLAMERKTHTTIPGPSLPPQVRARPHE